MKIMWEALDGRLKRRIIILLLFLLLIIILVISNVVNRNYSKTVSAAGYDCYENIIAITFDDGPRRGTTDKLLDGLKERGVKATFFLIGSSIEGNEDIVARMHEDGHLIGNHTYSHIQLSSVSTEQAYAEIVKTNEKIASITGETPKYIRPPYGTYSNKLLKRINMIPVLWSVDPDDWDTTDVNYVVKSVVNHVKCGDIILMHDFYDTSVTAALEIIDELQAKGYVFVTVDQLLLD
jgi:peptidoglycan/xylan/chitin deacetylase (PgdA/CDA1 family)